MSFYNGFFDMQNQAAYEKLVINQKHAEIERMRLENDLLRNQLYRENQTLNKPTINAPLIREPYRDTVLPSIALQGGCINTYTSPNSDGHFITRKL